MSNFQSDTSDGQGRAKKSPAGVQKGAFELGVMPISRYREKPPVPGAPVTKNLPPVVEVKAPRETKEQGPAATDKGSTRVAKAAATTPEASKTSPVGVPVETPEDRAQGVLPPIKDRPHNSESGATVSESSPAKNATTGAKMRNKVTGAASAARQFFLKQAVAGTVKTNQKEAHRDAGRIAARPRPVEPDKIDVLAKKAGTQPPTAKLSHEASETRPAGASPALTKTVIKEKSAPLKAEPGSITEKPRPTDSDHTVIKKTKTETRVHKAEAASSEKAGIKTSSAAPKAHIPVAEPKRQDSKSRPTEPVNTVIERAKAEARAHKPETAAPREKKKSKAKSSAAADAKQKTSQEPVAEGAFCDLHAAPKASHLTQIFYTLLILVLFIGWFYSGDEILTAKEGTGYYIGIIGGAMMLLLIIYPLRKTARFMRGMGAIRHWFRAHMILGLIGPVLIVFHANFEVGSLNSSIALGAMILVALSGLVGRYIYAGIHYGLYGKEMDLKGLKQDFERKISVMKYILDYAPALQQRLKDFDTRAARPRYSFLGSLLGLIRTSLGAYWLRLSLIIGLRRTLRVAARRNKWSPAELKSHTIATRHYIYTHISAARAISRFKVYERLFSLWHLLHMPLFLMLVLTALIHVVAVHMF